MPIFVTPIKCANHKWAKHNVWSLYQTACILSGVEPDKGSKTLYEVTSNILDLMGAAVEADTLQPVGNCHGDVSFYPSEVMAWAKTVGIEIAIEFEVMLIINSEIHPAGNSRKLIAKTAKNRALRSIVTLRKKLRLIPTMHRAAIEVPANTTVKTKNLMPHPVPQLGKDVTSAKNENHWLEHPNDPTPPEQPWYTPARYYARVLILEDSTLIKRRVALSIKVAEILADKKIYKRGGKKPLEPSTVLKALSNVILK